MPSLLLRLRIAVWRSRRLLLVLGLIGLCWACARVAAPAPTPTEPVLVAARDLVAGTVLAATDLRVVRAPRDSVPEGTLTVAADAVGHTLAVDLPAKSLLLATLLAGERFGLSPPSGTVTVPVRLADPAVTRLLRPGDRIDLVAPGHDAQPVVVLAHDALVLEVVTDDETGWFGAAEPSGTVIVVAVPPAAGHLLAGSGRDWLGAVLVEGS